MRIITRLLLLIIPLTIAIANASQGGDVKRTVMPLKIIENLPMISVQIQNKTFSVFVVTGNNSAALALFPDGR